jgi:hypothetical protein
LRCSFGRLPADPPDSKLNGPEPSEKKNMYRLVGMKGTKVEKRVSA